LHRPVSRSPCGILCGIVQPAWPISAEQTRTVSDERRRFQTLWSELRLGRVGHERPSRPHSRPAVLCWNNSAVAICVFDVLAAVAAQDHARWPAAKPLGSSTATTGRSQVEVSSSQEQPIPQQEIILVRAWSISGFRVAERNLGSSARVALCQGSISGRGFCPDTFQDPQFQAS
jgi:hypothetical protein